MPCSSTDDGAWGGCFASRSLATEPRTCTAVVSRHTSRPQRGQQCEAGMPEAAACRVACISSTDPIIDKNCNDSAVVSALALDGSSRLSSPSATPVGQRSAIKPMQLAAAAAASAAAQKNCEGNASDCESDLDFFTPLSSPLRELPTPSMPVAAVVQDSNAAHHHHEQLRQQQQQLQQPQAQRLEHRASLEMPYSSENGASLLLSSSISSTQQNSTSSLPLAKECGLLLRQFPLRRRYMSDDCGSSFLQQRVQQEQQMRPSSKAATSAAAAGLHFLAKTAANAAAAKERAPLIHRISRVPVQSRRCQGRPLLYQQQKHQFQWVQHRRQPQPLLQQQQRQQQQHRLQREASDEDIRMPLVPPPASSSPLLASSRVAPPSVGTVPFYTEEEAAATVAANDLPVAADSREAAALAGRGLSHSSNSAVLIDGEEQQLNRSLSLLATVRSQQQHAEGQVTEQQLPSQAQKQQQQQHKDDGEGLLQCSKRRRFSVERSESMCAMPTGRVAAAIPANVCIHTSSNNSDGTEMQRQRNKQHTESDARVDEIDFSSHRKRKRGGECSARLLLMLQPSAAAADAALLDVLGTALTAEETRELRMQQQREAEAAAAAAAAAEAAARERTAAAAAAEAAAARAKAAAEAQEVAARVKAQVEASRAAMASAAATSSRVTKEGTKCTLLQPGLAGATAANTVADGTPLFGTTGHSEPQQQMSQQLLLQQQQPQQPREQQIRQMRQPHIQQEQPHLQKTHDASGDTSGLGELTAVQGRPKLRIRRANGAPGAAPSSTGAGPGILAAPQQTVDFQQQQQPLVPGVPHNPSSLGQQINAQQQMDVQGAVFQAPHIQQQQQCVHQPHLPQQAQQPQLSADGLGLGLAEFGPTKVPDVTDTGSNPFAFVAGRGRGRGGRRGGMRRR